MKKQQKLNFQNIKDVLTRDELKMIMAGSGSGPLSCTASSSACQENVSCSCPGAGVCTGDLYKATCICSFPSETIKAECIFT